MHSILTCCATLLTIVGLIASPAAQLAGEPPPESEELTVNPTFLGHYTGEAENITFGQKGKMSINIEPSDKEGEVRVSMRASEGLVGEGDLKGETSADGELRASGEFRYCTLFGGCSRWMCNLTGTISGNRLKGTYELAVGSGPGTIIGEIWEKRPHSDNQEGRFDLQKFVPVYTPR